MFILRYKFFKEKQMKIISTLIATLVATAAFANQTVANETPAPCFPKPCTWATTVPVKQEKKDKKDVTPVTSKAESTITK
jgi:hypothetical protein